MGTTASFAIKDKNNNIVTGFYSNCDGDWGNVFNTLAYYFAYSTFSSTAELVQAVNNKLQSVGWEQVDAEGARDGDSGIFTLHLGMCGRVHLQYSLLAGVGDGVDGSIALCCYNTDFEDYLRGFMCSDEGDCYYNNYNNGKGFN